MEFGIIEILKLIGALGFFIYGMKIMSEGIQKAAGSGMRKILSTMTKNRYMGVLTGFLVTCLVQSSSASTVMAVSFVNAGLLSLVESAGIMLGANIGTTITGWLVAVLGFKVKMAAMALPLLAFGVPMMFMKKNRTKSIGQFIVGFAILFWGLSELKHSVPDIKNSPEILHFLGDYAHTGFLSNIFFIIVGTILTIVVQSSSASMALTQTLCFSGIIPFEVAAAMILGENIGTTITAELASLPANVHAKRSARIHSMFNIVGVSWAVLLITFTPALDGVRAIAMNWLGSADPMTAEGAPMGLAIFHTAFNVVNVGIMIWFVPLLVKLAIKSVKSKGEADEEYHLEYISTGIMSTPEMSIMEAQKEIAKFGEVVKRMNGFLKSLIITTDSKEISKTLARVKKYEDITDRIEVDVADYLAKVAEGEMSENSSIRVRGMLRIIGNLERMGDIYYQMSKGIERKNEQKVYFTPEQREKLLNMFELVETALENMVKNLDGHYEDISLTKATELENSINAYRKTIRKEHFESVERGDYNFQSATVYSELFNSLEKIGDHTINVTEGVTGEH
ncbi:Na/Pi cotransporter family protein [Vicingus serpentipes]|jgi:phosphate:Na+ symporter|uniref:Na/Pi cotransporter family protein n=1 Tax=Vicingus serpentipes TaxID=1926625 RepID=A0A5C6RR50_9FLAO|nr:Na/Pi cotransporter family protein [Vicingus serpentipes]TXB64748.1 Na/Pi cotransporter family protein [Vicingus serpentipes]